jgi:hemerythrin superfamily protein
VITKDHRALEALFEQVRAGGDRTALLDQIHVQLTAHAREEEQEVYPALRQADPGEEEEVEHAYDEHHEAEHLLRSARNLTVTAHFDEAFEAFVAAVGHHVEEEEQEVLPALRDAVDAATLRKLGAAFEKTKSTLVTELTDELATGDATRHRPRRRAAARGNAAKPSRKRRPAADATRDELYELAKRADIPGRSSMTKEQLAEALAKA